MDVLKLLTALLLSRVLAALGEGLGLASLTIYILSGYVLNHTSLKLLSEFDELLLDLSLITLFFYVGLNVDLRISRPVLRESLIISSSGVLTTLALVTSMVYLGGADLITSIVVGLALSNTATEVIFLALKPSELGIESVRKVIIASSFFDDLLMIGFISVLGAVSLGASELTYLSVRQVVFAVSVFSLGLLLTKVLSRRLMTRRFITNVAVLLLFSVTVAGYLAGVDLAFSAYFAGVALGMLRFVKDPMLVNIVRLNDLIQYFGEVLDIFLIPIFFLYIGSNLDLTLILNPQFFYIFTAAWVGKFLGCSLIHVVRGDLRMGLLYGVAMNARGGLESVAAMVAFKYGLITPSLYSAVVVTAVTSSIVVPLLIAVILKRLTTY
ncbi:MAG: cation:proton antiporter [Sulfolobales archaeon]|nr:cation:proton antiporter [Sulfolobales archaeon]MDW7970102.1 cation:proton antiporter [Sulfolobales archaeon]